MGEIAVLQSIMIVSQEIGEAEEVGRDSATDRLNRAFLQGC